MIPIHSDEEFTGAGNDPFAWDKDDFWKELEKSFNIYRGVGCDSVNVLIDFSISEYKGMIGKLHHEHFTPDNNFFDSLELVLFKTSTQIAACNKRAMEFIDLNMQVRELVKMQSINWDMNSPITRKRLYRLLYGNRAAIEEIILQMPEDKRPDWIRGTNEPSDTKIGILNNSLIRSGDILVSRGGAPVSALISRGNDYPGNFSHVALALVDSNGNLNFIESHIESGVITTNVNEYLSDRKFRIMILRPRYEMLKNVFLNTKLPDEAAHTALHEQSIRHIPYDFEMNFYEPTEMFCSEVVYFSYKKHSLELWSGMTLISSRGIVNWLGDFGVEHFTSVEPSDLEYDPQLSVVAEWRDPRELQKDHVDNAVMDIMLEDADNGEVLDYNIFLLPVARMLKGYSWILNQFELKGPIPEGMSPISALKEQYFSSLHSKLAREVMQMANEFKFVNGYNPPYWDLLKMARSSKNKINSSN
ncbi:hypothetical protein FBQ84_01215 [Ignavibacteria bacterium CHB1]|nr:hypothetical protein [Ignavibacteria bacterium]MCC6886596.1 hypothetical protein [Ignavibacteriales bacterium]MCE7952329.1 hypothetical protein [Chlorobi bacterium CHB7]MDL1886447.1 hypothetical protein [Ignavibacteria bacterium CHB1]RIK48042.1 MAG: hypothetical protein DCC60_08575 [Ignavibacteriota bacterium]